MLKKILKKIIAAIPLRFCEFYLNAKFGYPMLTYSQFGEDIILRNLFSNKQRGFYIDIGAHHPIRFSNTYLFYLKGWHGINIDGTPGSMNPFYKNRKKDINLELGVGDHSTVTSLFIYKKPALNTASVSVMKKLSAQGIHPIETKSIFIDTLEHILDKYLPTNKKIDFMTIDIEGNDLLALKSNNWEKYSPLVIAVEDQSFNAQIPEKSQILNYLNLNGYRLECSIEKTLFFKKNV